MTTTTTKTKGFLLKRGCGRWTRGFLTLFLPRFLMMSKKRGNRLHVDTQCYPFVAPIKMSHHLIRISCQMSGEKFVHWRILQNWEILETRNLFCAAGYFCNRQSCPSKGWLCRESSETVLKKVEIGAKNLRKHFLENISYRLFRTFL